MPNPLRMTDAPHPRADSGETYPAILPVLLSGSNEEQIDDLVVDEAVGGGVRVRAMFPVRKRRFVMKHVLSLDDCDYLLAFYDANRLYTFTLNWPPCGIPLAYTVVFEAPPKITTNAQSVTHKDCEVRLREV